MRYEEASEVDLTAALAPEVPVGGTNGVEVTIDTPDAAAVSAIESSLRLAQGVSGTMITSLSIGGASRLQISYAGDFATLRWALDQRGWRLDELADGYRMRKRKDGEGSSEEHTSELQSLMRITY